MHFGYMMCGSLFRHELERLSTNMVKIADRSLLALAFELTPLKIRNLKCGLVEKFLVGFRDENRTHAQAQAAQDCLRPSLGPMD
jgi:hypothetical protein